MREANNELTLAFDKITDHAFAAAGFSTLEEAQQKVLDIIEMAEEWYCERLPLDAIKSYCTGAERALAMRVLKPSPTNPAPASFMAMLDALIAEQKDERNNYAYTTKHGVFLDEDFTEGKTKQNRTDDGQIRIRFPQRQPWESYPKKSGATQEQRDGTRAEPYFAADQEDRQRVANEFAQKRMGDGPSEPRSRAPKSTN